MTAFAASLTRRSAQIIPTSKAFMSRVSRPAENRFRQQSQRYPRRDHHPQRTADSDGQDITRPPAQAVPSTAEVERPKTRRSCGLLDTAQTTCTTCGSKLRTYVQLTRTNVDEQVWEIDYPDIILDTHEEDQKRANR
jgi:hypothetical protein